MLAHRLGAPQRRCDVDSTRGGGANRRSYGRHQNRRRPDEGTGRGRAPGVGGVARGHARQLHGPPLRVTGASRSRLRCGREKLLATKGGCDAEEVVKALRGAQQAGEDAGTAAGECGSVE